MALDPSPPDDRLAVEEYSVRRRRIERYGLRPLRLISRPTLWLLGRLYGTRPVPLRLVSAVGRVASGHNSLVDSAEASQSDSLDDLALREILGDQVLGVWSLGPKSIAEVSRRFRATKPQRVLEFGSGASTVCLAYLAREVDVSAHPAVVALDQDATFADATRDRLDRAGLSAYATVIHAPLVQTRIGKVSYSCYEVPPEFDAFMSGSPAQFVLVDGPYAEPGARYATIPTFRNWIASGATVLLDDALRDGELAAARRWHYEGWINVSGISLIEKGLLVAEVRHQGDTTS